MIENNGIQTYYSKSPSIEKVKLFEKLELFLIEMPEIWDEIQIDSFINSFDISIDRDHVFFQRRINTYFTRFKNIGGEFDLCGSGLYSLAVKLFSEEVLDETHIIFRTKKDQFINAKIARGKIVIEFKKTAVSKICTDSWISSTGVYIKQLDEGHLNALTLEDIINLQYPEEANHRPGGFCGFRKEDDTIHLRYFSPWHGRNEDFATLSIFKYLGHLLKNGDYKINQNGHHFSCTILDNSVLLSE